MGIYSAQIDNKTNICRAITETPKEIIPPEGIRVIMLSSYDDSRLGKSHDAATGKWSDKEFLIYKCE